MTPPGRRRFEPRISLHHTVLGVLVTAAFAFSAASSIVPTVDASRGASDTSDTASLAVSRVIDSLQAKGLTCQDSSELTDTVVFQHNDQSVRVVSFDEAYALGQAGQGWVRAYCA